MPIAPNGRCISDVSTGEAPNSVFVDEGATAANTGTVSHPEGDTVTLSASVGTVVNNDDGTWSWWWPTSGSDDSQTVTITATDSNGDTSTTPFALTVNDVAPEDADGDGVPDADDLCPETVTDPAPAQLKPNRNSPNPTTTFGCSPTQIIEDAGLGNGHLIFGISNSAVPRRDKASERVNVTLAAHPTRSLFGSAR